MDLSPPVCTCTATSLSSVCLHGSGGISCGGLDCHLALVQLQRPGAAASVGPGLWQGQEREGAGRESGTWHQETQIRVGQKQATSAGVHGICAHHQFLRDKDAKVINKLTGTVVTHTPWLILVVSAFLLCFQPSLCITAMLIS